MTYTVRFAHLSEIHVRPGQTVKRGEKIGRMGNTGASQGAHLHLDVVEGIQAGRYTLTDMALGKPRADAKQATLFIDAELFGVEPIVTTYYSDPAYYKTLAKWHFGYDLVPSDRHKTQEHFDILWNRSMPGRVTKIMTDDPGYGNCVMIAYEA